jgi:hypothetical protein
MRWRRLLICGATVVALLVSVYLCLQVKTPAMLANGIAVPDYQSTNVFDCFRLPTADQAESSYPFVWQRRQRERLRALLQQPSQAPNGTDAVALARYVQYALAHGDETVLREGLRREPHNALYHYLLAELYLKRGLRTYGLQLDGKTLVPYDYTVTERRQLDQGMRELALGAPLPLQTHHGALLRAQLDAMPPMPYYMDRLGLLGVIDSNFFPTHEKLSNLARANNSYLSLSLLLSERKRADSAPRHLAMARTMISVYAVMTLFFAALLPLCAAFERDYVRADRIMTPMRQGEDISSTMVEGQVAIMLRNDVREGATTLGIAWR